MYIVHCTLYSVVQWTLYSVVQCKLYSVVQQMKDCGDRSSQLLEAGAAPVTPASENSIRFTLHFIYSTKYIIAWKLGEKQNSDTEYLIPEYL